MQEYLQHPFGMFMPAMNKDEYDTLVASLKEYGYDNRHPIVIYQGKVLDHWHLYTACKELGISCLFVEFEGSDVEALSFVKREGFVRRNMSNLQRGNTALKLKEEYQRMGAKPYQAMVQAASDAGISLANLYRLKLIAEKAVPIVKEAVAAGEIDAKAGAAIAAQHPAEQKAALKQATKKKPPTQAKPMAVVNDKLGNKLPDCLKDAFADTGLTDAVAMLKRCREIVTSAALKNQYIDLAENVEALDTAITGLTNAMPWVVHTACEGKGCPSCRQTGFWPKWVHDEQKK